MQQYNAKAAAATTAGWRERFGMRRRKLLVVLAGLAVVAAAGVVVLRPREDRITRANYDRIQIGMSRAHVEAILGPQGDYTTAPVEAWGFFAYVSRGATDPGTPMSTWDGDQGSIRLAFDQQDKVAWGDFQSHHPVDLGTLDLVLFRAKRQWHRWFP
jgi:hypothetical protein